MIRKVLVHAFHKSLKITAYGGIVSSFSHFSRGLSFEIHLSAIHKINILLNDVLCKGCFIQKVEGVEEILPPPPPPPPQIHLNSPDAIKTKILHNMEEQA